MTCRLRERAVAMHLGVSKKMNSGLRSRLPEEEHLKKLLKKEKVKRGAQKCRVARTKHLVKVSSHRFGATGLMEVKSEYRQSRRPIFCLMMARP